VWASRDGGGTWSRVGIPSDQEAFSAVTAVGDAAVVVGNGARGLSAWIGRP
jgi:photosystem II stability/assembly factor-like uncharacterized protein